METVKGQGKTQKTISHVVQFTTGWSVLPWDGGMMDQPHRLMSFFEIFQRIDRETTFKNLK